MFNYLLVYLAMLLGAICTLITITAMRRREKHNVGKFGWLLLILLTPPIGLILFVFFSGNKISAEHESRDLVDLPEPDDDQTAVENFIARVAMIRGIPAPTRPNRLEFLTTPQAMYDGLFELIASAEKRLFVHTFILIDDNVGNRIIDELCNKANNGVEVRLMIDGFGSFLFPDSLLEKVEHAGGKTTRFKPLGHFSRFAYSNFRNHRKMVIADGNRALVGGANLVEYEMTQTPDEDTWLDYAARVDGLAARQIEAVFLSDWNFACGEQLKPTTGDVPAVDQNDLDTTSMQVVPVGADGPDEVIDDLWLTAINRAKDRIWIVTPYFVPSPMAIQSLAMAARRGVDVRTIYPDKSDVRPADFARFDYARDVQKQGAEVMRIPNAMIHAKMLLVDEDVAFIGSANFDMRSFFLNYELVLCIYGKSKINELAKWFNELASQCSPGIKEETRTRRVLSVLTRIFDEEL